MRKYGLSILFAAMLGFSLFADPVAPTKDMTLGQLIRLSSTGGKATKVRSAQLVYEVSGPKLPLSFLLIRAQNGTHVRLDIITVKGYYIACRDDGKFWGCDEDSGVIDLSPEEIREMKCDLAFLPFPFMGSSAYVPLTPAGQGAHLNMQCNVYKTHPVDRPSEKVTCWVDPQTGLLRLIKTSSPEGYYSSSFRDYQEIGGLQIASLIHISNAHGTVKMKLRSVDWNADFPDNLFDKGVVLQGPLVKKFQQELASRKAEAAPRVAKRAQPKPAAKAPDPAKAAADNAARAERVRQQKIEKLEKDIRRFDIEIDVREKKLVQLERVFAADRSDAVSVAKESSKYSYRNAWSYRGWYSSSSSRADRVARKTARKLAREAEAAAEEYEKLSKELTDLRIQRSDAKAALEKLQKQAPKM